MQCRLCNVTLAPLRSLTDGEFCCDDHRRIFFEERSRVERVGDNPGGNSLFCLHLAVTGAAPEAVPPKQLAETVEFLPPASLLCAVPPAVVPPIEQGSLSDNKLLLPLYFEQHPADVTASISSGFSSIDGTIPEPRIPRVAMDLVRIECEPVIEIPAPVVEAAPSREVPIVQEFAAVQEAVASQESAAILVPPPSATAAPEASSAEITEATADGSETEESAKVPRPTGIAGSWHWLKDAWRTAPADLRTMAVLLPLLLAVAVSGSIPMVTIPRVSSGSVQNLLSDHWKNIHQTILNRAAVAFADDFRSGLDAWDSRSNLTTSWSYDATGFVQPGPLAVFKPTVDLSDYHFEFLGEIDQKGMGCAFRASDLNNYYAVRFVVVKPGPMPLVHLVRYAVINGKEGPHVEKPLPLTTRADMLYRVSLDVRGSDFTIMAQGQVVDFWSDSRLQRGGVGFFCNRGEKARVRWVEVSHQYDALGRLCAYLAPLGVEGRNGNLN
jgi:hypothetical protein